MFSFLKKKLWGQDLFSVPVGVSGKGRVYLWDRDGDRSINIQSERYMQVNTGFSGYATVTFDASEARALAKAILSIEKFDKQSRARA
jgi:hypothetical protein